MTTPKKTTETVLDKISSAVPEAVPPVAETTQLKSQITGKTVGRPVAPRPLAQKSDSPPLFSGVSIAIIAGLVLIALVSVILSISTSSEVSSMRQDLTNLKQRVDIQLIEIEELEQANAELRAERDEVVIQADNMTILIEDQQRNLEQLDEYIVVLKERNRVLGGRNEVLTNMASRFERENTTLKSQIHEYKRLIDSLVITNIEINQAYGEGIPIDVLDTLKYKMPE